MPEHHNVAKVQTLYSCVLCGSTSTQLWHVETRPPLAGREFHQCLQCHVVFVPSPFHISAADELAIYQQHENSPDDQGYRKFLSRTLDAVLPWLPESAHGLDFGSGPGPVLDIMFAEHGHHCANYDLYFANQPERLQTQYDFITATEVIEHLADPLPIFTQLFECLKPGGVLAVMTQKPTTLQAFARWQYILDPTHITFYRDPSFAWISAHFRAPIVHRGRDVIVFQNTPAD